MIAASTDKTIFHLKAREVVGKKVSSLRQDGLLPGNIYGLGKDSVPVVADRIAFFKLYEEEGDTGLIYLDLGDQKKQVPVLIDEVEYHPVTGELQHVVFRRVNLAEKIEAEVPIELVGENEVPGAAIITVRDSLEVRALPAELPENFEVDISTLTEFGQSLTIADLEVDTSKVEIVMTGEMTPESPLVILQEVKEEEVEEEEVKTDVEDVEIEEKGKKDDEDGEGEKAGEGDRPSEE